MPLTKQDLHRLVYDEFGDELEEKDEEIKNIKTTTKQKDKKIKEGLKKLLKMTDDPKMQEKIISIILDLEM